MHNGPAKENNCGEKHALFSLFSDLETCDRLDGMSWLARWHCGCVWLVGSAAPTFHEAPSNGLWLECDDQRPHRQRDARKPRLSSDLNQGGKGLKGESYDETLF
jgi:hypothetical protein